MSALIPLFGEGKRPSVKRCLFGRPNRENLENHLEQQENKLNQDIEIAAKKFSDKWGLNPITGEKTTGQYIVTPFDVSEYVPAFYLKGYSRRKPKSCRVTLESSRSRSSSPMNIRDFLSKPRPSCKRRLPLDGEECNSSSNIVNDENILDVSSRLQPERLQVPVAAVANPTPSSSVESSPSNSDYSPAPSPASLQAIQHRTPGLKTQQTQMQDFFPLHKRPRTKQSET